MNLRFRIRAAFFVHALAGIFASAQTGAFLVHTNSGDVRGVARATGGAEFLGIPYAEPPIGNLRWHEPLPVKPWSGVRDVSAFGAPCAQPDLGAWNRHDAETGKEDCLFLNVITPAWPAQNPLPVMFWIHGGANAGGTASSALYKDGTLVQHGVILVTVNYRLSVFGFLAHPGLTRESAHASSGNYGLEDQILALRWTRANIAKFGGDPNNITVFGQSAGAIDTGLLMTSPERGEFQKAIAESGAAFTAPLPTLAEAEKNGASFASALHAPDDPAAAVQFLRGLSAADLIKSLVNPALAERPRIGPNVDGWVIPDFPTKVFAAGKEASIPLLIGVQTREFGSQMDLEHLRLEIRRLAGAHAADALKAYGIAGDAPGAVDPLYGTPADQWAADIAFHCPCAAQAQWHSAAQHPAYLYQFDHPIPGQEAQGAVHSGELPYVFGYFPKAGNIAGNFTDADFKLADLVETYWTNFARTGDPNGAGVARWEPLHEGAGYLEFGLDGKPAFRSQALRPAQCSVYRAVVGDRMK